MEEKEPEKEKKDDESRPLVLPPPPPEIKKDEPSTLEKVLENNVDITEDSVGAHITIEF
jgi:hypothetical protein